MMEENQLVYRMAFASLRGMTPGLASNLLDLLGDEYTFFSAEESTLMAIAGQRWRMFSAESRRQALERAQREAEFVKNHGVRVTFWRNDENYPARLRECEDAPLMLYSLGECDLNRCKTIGIVGTRHATPYGIEFVKKLVAEVAEKVTGDVAIVSGLAIGIDAAAHQAALSVGVPTVGVLAHGLNTIYPAVHRGLAADVVRKGGILLTEYGSADAIHRGNFLARNRIVAGLSDCVVVAESAIKGGALVTARLAAGYNRDVFALPGRTSDIYSAGCNELVVAHVAAIVRNADDIINTMGWERKTEVVEPEQLTLFPELSDDEQAVVEYLRQNDGAILNRLSVDLNMSVGKMMALLVDMEFKGVVLSYPGGRYRLA